METNILDQIQLAYKRTNLLAILLGTIPALIPIFAFSIKNFGMNADVVWYAQVQTYIVTAGLCYSSHTVWKWMTVFTGGSVKAACFVILLEGGMMFGNILPLSLVALGVLVFANQVAATCNLVLAQKAARKSTRVRRVAKAKKTPASVSQLRKKAA